MTSVKKHRDFLRYLHTSPPRQSRIIVRNATPGELKALCYICKRILRGDVVVPRQKSRGIKRFGQRLRALVGSKSTNKQRQILQSGGFLPFLLPVLGTVVASLLKTGIERGLQKT